MGIYRIILVVITALLLLGACTGNGEPDLQPLTAAEVSGERLWDRITTESDYTKYSQWPGHQGKQPGQSPHGIWHQVYANKALYSQLPIEDAVAPKGSILVKENYDSDENLVKLTVMAKVEDFNPAGGDWFWASYDPDGTVSAAGNLQGCISCHSGMADNDYVIIKLLDRPVDG